MRRAGAPAKDEVTGMENKRGKKALLWWIVPLVALAAAAVLLIRLRRLNMLPDRTVLRLAAVLAAGLVLTAVTMAIGFAVGKKLRRVSRVFKILSAALAIFLIGISIYGTYLTETVSRTLTKVTSDNGKNEVSSTVVIYVPKDGGITKLSDLKGRTVAWSEGYGKKQAEPVVKWIEKNRGVSMKTKSYPELVDAIDDLLDHKVDALIVESSYLEAIVEDSEMENFWDETRNIAAVRTYTDGRMEETKTS